MMEFRWKISELLKPPSSHEGGRERTVSAHFNLSFQTTGAHIGCTVFTQINGEYYVHRELALQLGGAKREIAQPVLAI